MHMPTFYNQATLTYNGTTINSNIVSGELAETLSVTKNALVDFYSPDTSLTYVVSIINTGSTPYTGLTVTDNLGEYPFEDETRAPLAYTDDSLFYLVNGIPQPRPVVTDSSPLTVTGISVPAGGNAVLIYQTTLTEFAPLAPESSIVNEVTVSGTGISELNTTETVTVREEALLTITKSLSPTTVPENGQLTYTFVIENRGNAPIVATDNAVITDAFDPILENLMVTFNGEAWSTPANYAYDEETGVFTSIPGQITVPAATYVQDPATGAWTVTPGMATLTVTGNI